MALSKRAATADETRRNKRITRVLPVDCKIIDFADHRVSKHALNEGDSFGGRTINISKDGLQIHSDFELDKKTKVDVTLSVNESGKPKIKVSVEVAWARRNAFDIYGRWAMGMRIISAKEADIAALEEFFNED